MESLRPHGTVDGSQPGHLFGSFHGPMLPSLLHTALQYMTMGTFHHAAADEPTLGAMLGIVHTLLVRLVVANQRIERLALGQRTHLVTTGDKLLEYACNLALG